MASSRPTKSEMNQKKPDNSAAPAITVAAPSVVADLADSQDPAERDFFTDRMQRMFPAEASSASVSVGVGVPRVQRCGSSTFAPSSDSRVAIRRSPDDAPMGHIGLRTPGLVMVSDEGDDDAARLEGVHASEIDRIAHDTGDPRMLDMCIAMHRHEHDDKAHSRKTIQIKKTNPRR